MSQNNFCSSCGNKLEAEDKFCSSCGGYIQETVIQETQVSKRTTSRPVLNLSPY